MIVWLRCIEHLTNLTSARRKIFVFRDRPARRDDVLAFYGEGAAVRPLAFSAVIKDMKALLHNA